MTNSRVYLGSRVGGLMEKLFTEVWAGLMKTYRGWYHSSDLHRPRLKGKGKGTAFAGPGDSCGHKAGCQTGRSCGNSPTAVRREASEESSECLTCLSSG